MEVQTEFTYIEARVREDFASIIFNLCVYPRILANS